MSSQLEMRYQLDLFAADVPTDAYCLTLPRVTPPVLHGGMVPPVSRAVTPLASHVWQDDVALHAPSAPAESADAVAFPVVLQQPASARGAAAPALTPDGQLLSVPCAWDWEARRDTYQYLLARTVGAPVSWQRITSPRGTELDARRSGSLYLVGGNSRDVLVRLSSSAAPDSRQSRISLHMNERTLDEMRHYRSAYQAVITRVRQPGRIGRIVTAAIPFAVLEPLVADALATAPDGRAALSLEVTCTARGLSLRVPEADLDVSHYAGVEALAAELRGDPGEPWRALHHSDWMAVVAAVLTLRDSLHCSVAPLDSRKRVTREVLAELRIGGVYGHRLGLPAASPESLVYTDLLAAPVTADLWRRPAQALTAIEIDAKADMTAVQELALRMHSADALGLNLTRAIVVADAAKRAKYETRRSLLRERYQCRLEFWPMDDVYQSYRTLREERLRQLTLSQRVLVRRAA